MNGCGIGNGFLTGYLVAVFQRQTAEAAVAGSPYGEGGKLVTNTKIK